jgi:hypothetical protein
MKKAQVQVSFNWIFVLIAGAVIIFFFIGLATWQKESSEEELSIEAVQMLDSLFTAAQAADKTTNQINLGGLSQYVLSFDCLNEVSEFYLEGTNFRQEEPLTPLFTPRRVQSSQLTLLSWPFSLPYRGGDLLMVSSPGRKYYLLGEDFIFIEDFLNRTKGLDIEYLPLGLSQVDPQNLGLSDVRLIDTLGGNIIAGSLVPEKFSSLQLSAVSFAGDKINYYSPDQDGIWHLTGSLPLLSGSGKVDSSKYAAVFAEDADLYWCNLQKALRRMDFVDQAYISKAEEVISDYDKSNDAFCKSALQEILSEVKAHKIKMKVCSNTKECQDLVASSERISRMNDDLRKGMHPCAMRLY